MNIFRIALANLRYPNTREQSVQLAEQAIADAAVQGAALICFPECYVPGYRAPGKGVLPPDAAFLEDAWSAVAAAAAKAKVVVVLGTERMMEGVLLMTALVINRDGTMAGFQDKVQIDPSEEPLYTPGSGRHVFHCGPLTFGVAICHEGWRYPETVRWALVAALMWCFIRISRKPSLAATLPRASLTQRTRSTKKLPCAELPKTLATSRQ